MIANHKARWCFVCVPKCGTNTLREVLLRPEFGGELVGTRPISVHRMDAPSGYRTFAVWRDPFDRVVSMFRHHRKSYPERPESLDFGRFVANLASRGNDHAWAPFNMPQAWYWEQVPGGIHHFLRLESLGPDLEPLGLHAGPLPAVPTANASSGPMPEWTPELREVVSRWASDDYPLQLFPRGNTP